jgi:hypothetical protein
LARARPRGSPAPTSATPVAAVAKPSLTEPAGLAKGLKALWEGTVDALYALPNYFASRLVLQDVLATDLHTFNNSLGATIEQQVVNTLNSLRDTWDDGSWALYRWERQSQRFPDVVLRTAAPGKAPDPVMGIELKGWYVLAREREPSARFKVTPAVCAPIDLLAIVPWALDAAISGSPRLFDPYVVNARPAAEYRNYWWENIRNTSADRSLKLSSVTHAYPTKDEKIQDVPAKDAGNFGRYSRSGAMQDYIATLFKQKLAGIPLDDWQNFLKRFAETSGE